MTEIQQQMDIVEVVPSSLSDSTNPEIESTIVTSTKRITAGFIKARND